MTANPTFSKMFHQLLKRPTQTRAARSVEIFGWIMMIESTVVLIAPQWVASILFLPPLMDQSATYFRIGGMLLGGLGILYVASGRLNATGFVFASLLDRPLSPVMMALLWYLGIVPGSLALVFSISDFATFLWTLLAWRAEMAPSAVKH